MLSKMLALWLFTITLTSQAQAAIATATNTELNIGTTQEFETLNNMTANMLVTRYVTGFTSRFLVGLTTDNQWIPVLVKSIPSLENGQAKVIAAGATKKIQANWEIRSEAVWGDGTPITGDDVLFSWELANNPNISVPGTDTFKRIEKIEVDKKNPKRFQMTFREANWDFGRIGNFFVLPKHLEEPVAKKFGGEKEGYQKNTVYTSNPTNPGLYNGPYRVAEVKLGSHISLVKNEKWWGKTKPKIEKINIKLIPNTNTLEANLLSGTIQAINTLGMSLDQAIAFEKKVKAESLPFRVDIVPSTTYEHIDFNLKNPILADKRVRQAIAYATDREKLVQALFEGRQKRAYHFLTPVDSFFTTDAKIFEIYTPSLTNAEMLLDEAGWKKGSDGIRTKDGQRLTINLMTTAGNKVRETVQVYLQNEWKKAGIEMTIKNEQPRVFFGETQRKGLFPGGAMFAWTSYPEQSPKNQLHSKLIPTAENGFSGSNAGSFSNAKMDSLIDKYEVEMNASKRRGIAHELIKIYADEVATLPLYYRSQVSVVPKNLKNFKTSPHLSVESNEAEVWSLE